MPSFTEKDMSAALQMVAEGCPASHQQVREFASKIAVRNGFPEGVGKNWLQGFLGRNPDIRTLKGKKIDSDRYQGASSELIKAFFMLLMCNGHT
uniref:HTH CENPB-type domain-containing protein n=1 Tax=Fusarium oxysporum (strain Fo5176) TaxID=660025 RepID=A0A0C4BKY5_FUSOF